MLKWLGKVDNAVYSDSTEARVAGAGVISATDFDDESLPDISGFTGTLALTNDFSLVVGSPIAVEYSVALPSGRTVSIEVPNDTENDTYPLLTAPSITGFEGVTFVLAGDVAGKYRFEVTCEGDVLKVRLREITGMKIFVR